MTFRELDPKHDWDALVDLLTTETWPHRVRPAMTEADVREEIANGHYVPGRSLAFLIELEGELAGVAAAHGVANEHADPELDFRIRERARGRGLGLAALRRITAEVFSRHPSVHRIEGRTRRDNAAMRRVFERGGYVQEAVYRAAWPGDGGPYDSIGYAILRADFASGNVTPVVWG